jgi:hypothetical protein
VGSATRCTKIHMCTRSLWGPRLLEYLLAEDRVGLRSG